MEQEETTKGPAAAEVLLDRFRHTKAGSALSGPRSRLIDLVPANMRILLAVVLAVVVVVLAVVAWQAVAAPTPIEQRMSNAPVVPEEQATDGDELSPSGSDGAPVLVHIAGAVAQPGVVELPVGSRVTDAVSAAGGLASGAEPDRVNLAAPLVDGSWIVIPVRGEELPAGAVPTSSPSAVGGGSEGSAPELVDLNSADAAALEDLPGVGPATAEAIVSHRESEGPFGSVDDLLAVRGIGEAKLEGLRDHATVSQSGPAGSE